MDLLQQVLQNILAQVGYTEIIIVMLLESSLVPLPSEIIMIPVGYLAATGELNVWLAIMSATLGCVLGATVNYLLARHIGKALILKYGKYFLIDHHRYHLAEKMFLENAYKATFIGRLLPVVRQFVPLPAGAFGMAFLPFVALTALGAGIWCTFLILSGYFLGEKALEIVSAYSYYVAAFVALCVLSLGIWKYVIPKIASIIRK